MGAGSTGPELTRRARRALDWLFDAALPVSLAHARNPAGGWHDRLDDDLRPTDAPMRLLVQMRQVFVFAEAGRLGWPGPWRDGMEHGLSFLRERAAGPDGRLARTFDASGAVLDAQVDLYTCAFVLLGLATAFAATGDAAHRHAAAGLRQKLQDRLAHRRYGFRDLDGGLRANPNMHLFEAFLHWADADRDPTWTMLADAQARLCADRLEVEPGVLHEVFLDDWRPAPPPEGERIEPGHHFEWGWLLHWRSGADQSLALRLCERAEAAGVDTDRGVAVNLIDPRGTVLDADARLWPQTERLKAALAFREHDERWTERARQAHDALFRYTEGAPEGLWRDVMTPDGRLRPEGAPTSSLYHITGAISELARAAGVAEARW